MTDSLFFFAAEPLTTISILCDSPIKLFCPNVPHLGSPNLSARWQSEINQLESNGVTVEPSEITFQLFFEEQKVYVRYNLDEYVINGFRYGDVLEGDEYVGQLVWMGRHQYDKPRRDNIDVGLRLVSLSLA